MHFHWNPSTWVTSTRRRDSSSSLETHQTQPLGTPGPSQLTQRKVTGAVQPGRTGFGWVPTVKRRSKANAKKRQDLVISEVVRMEEESSIKGGRQTGRQWWRDPLPGGTSLSYDLSNMWHPSEPPENQQREAVSCAQNPSLQHILSSCKSALTQGSDGERKLFCLSRFSWTTLCLGAQIQLSRKATGALKASSSSSAQSLHLLCWLIFSVFCCRWFKSSGTDANKTKEQRTSSLLPLHLTCFIIVLSAFVFVFASLPDCHYKWELVLWPNWLKKVALLRQH